MIKVTDERTAADAIDVLADGVLNIAQIYEIRSEIFTNDADLAQSMYDRARAILTRLGVKL